MRLLTALSVINFFLFVTFSLKNYIKDNSNGLAAFYNGSVANRQMRLLSGTNAASGSTTTPGSTTPDKQTASKVLTPEEKKAIEEAARKKSQEVEESVDSSQKKVNSSFSTALSMFCIVAAFTLALLV